MTDLPRKAVVRSAKLATVPLGFAGRTALGLGKRLGGKPAEIVAAELQARTAQQLFQVLGELKGGAMKFGQALSIFEAALPEDLAVPYRAMLTKLQDSAPADADELGARRAARRPRHALAQQVRAPSTTTPWPRPRSGRCTAAVWKDGRDVAVKIQYPGAGAALMSDIRQISRVAKVAASWVPGHRARPDPRRAARPDGRGARLPPRGRVAGDLRSGLRRRPRLRRAPRRRGPRARHRVGVARGHAAVADHRRRHPGAARHRLAALPALPAGRPGPGRAAARRPAPRQLPHHPRRPPGRHRLRRRQPAPRRHAARDRAAAHHRPRGQRRGRARGAARDRLRQGRASTSTRSGCSTTSSRSWRPSAPTRSPSAGTGSAASSPTSTTRASPTTPSRYKLNLPPEYLLIHRVWGGGHRGAQPARRHRARARHRRRAASRGGPAARRRRRRRAEPLVTTRRGRACSRSSGGSRGCSARTSTSCARRRCLGST